MAKGKTSIILAMLFAFALVFSANNVTALSFSYVLGGIVGLDFEGIEISEVNEQYIGSAEARDDDEFDSDSFSEDHLPIPPESFGAYAEATHALSLSGPVAWGVPGVVVYAEADWPDNQWAMAEAYGSYRVDFTALETGLLEIEFFYAYLMELQKEFPHEDAWADFGVSVSLSGELASATYTDPVDEFWDSFTLSKEFEQGESGFYEMYFWADATAVSPVPEPSTMLLLGSGLLGLVGFRRKLRD